MTGHENQFQIGKLFFELRIGFCDKGFFTGVGTGAKQNHSWSNEGDTVLDPLMGSGTTAKMALLNNRQYIGFEISKEYCDIANERLANVGKIF